MTLGGAQLGYNWQAPETSFVFGVEADASILGSDGTNTCLATSGAILSANCHVSQRFVGTIAGRAGYALGADARTLLFLKAGGAALHQNIEITTNGGPYPPLMTNTSSTRYGWVGGAGVERALTPAWSLKLEYDYMDFGTGKVATPATFLQAIPGVNAYFAIPGGTTDARQTVHAVKLGVNARLGEDWRAVWRPSESDYRLRGAVPAHRLGADVEVGTRAWHSFGRHQKDLGGSTLPVEQNFLVSRLTYDTSAWSGEIFARVDTQEGVFVKGFAGGGTVASGKMHDEDWLLAGATVPYSNTLSKPVKGSLGYAVLDAGYAMFRGPSAKVGAFVGYSFLKDSFEAFGCTQAVLPNVVCTPAIPDSTLVITQDNVWHAARLGLSGVATVANGLTLSAEAAWLPVVSFRGVDNHLLRTDVPDTVSKEKGKGQGVQLEALLAYSFDPSFSVGAGGRYWAMWTDEDALTNIFGTACPCQTLPSRTERYGAFVQASYKFGGLK
jgi:opacity protein-like surface antigen